MSFTQVGAVEVREELEKICRNLLDVWKCSAEVH
jgi:hypothetical protein